MSRKLFVSMLLIIAILVGVNSVYAHPQPNRGEGNFNWGNHEVTPEDLFTLDQYIKEHGFNENNVLKDIKKINSIIKKIANNKELKQFVGSKFSFGKLKSAHQGTLFVGKSHNQFNVYISIFEVYDKVNEKGWNLSVYYDIDRNLLIEATFAEMGSGDIVVNQFTNGDIPLFKGKEKDVHDCKDCNNNTSPSKDIFASFVLDKNASAGHQTPPLPDASCKWIMLPTCIVWE